MAAPDSSVVREQAARPRRHSGVVGQDVDGADALEGCDGDFVGDVEHVTSACFDPIAGEAFGDGLPDSLRSAGDDDDATQRSAFRSSLPDVVFGGSSTIRTSRRCPAGEPLARTKSCSVFSSTGPRATTKARASVGPFSTSADDRSFDDLRMLDEAVLDLCRGHRSRRP